MKFAFPKDKKTESVNISVYKTDIDKIRKLAELNNCSQVDVYKTLVSEAIEEYEERFGSLDGKPAKPQFSVKRDYVEAGDNRRKEVSGDEFDGGGDLRTKEAKAEKNKAAVELGTKGGIKGGPARAAKLSPERGTEIARNAALTRHHGEMMPEKLPKEWWKEENLGPIENVKSFVHRQPLPENFDGETAFCQYLMCNTKKYKRDDGIEADGRNFCSEKCYADWKESGKKINLHN